MATTTTRLGLRKPAGADFVTVSTDIDASMDTIDVAIDRVCTSSTRPSTTYAGMGAYETDTKNTIRRNSGNTQWEHLGLPIVSSTASILAPYAGQMIINTTDNLIYKYTGSVWLGCIALGGSTAATRHECRYIQTTAQTGLTAGVLTAMAFNSLQYDTSDVTASGTNNNLFTLNRAGAWRCTVNTRLLAGTISGSTAEAHVCIAGAAADNTNRFASDNKFGNASALTYMINLEFEKQFSAGSTIAANVVINNSGTWGSNLNSESNSITFKWLGPVA